MRLFITAFAIFLFGFSAAAAEETDTGIENIPANHVYVVRRPLGGPNDWEPLVNRWRVVHSALLFETTDDRYALLEYMGDGKTYLSEAKPELIEKQDGYVIIRMKGHYDDGNKKAGPTSFRWTRQERGVPLPKPMKLADLKAKMSELMAGTPYSLTKHNCHKAQESLRKSIGLTVD